MHIPDGYLSPQTAGIMYLIMVPIWLAAGKAVRSTLKVRQIPYMAMAAAFCFVIMLFNIPTPGGSTGHAVGSTLIAILLGPWASVIAITISLVIQALLFGDGGITAIGANCFNIAFVATFSGYFVYKAISIGSDIKSRRRVFAAFIGAYIGLNLAALATAFEFGIQPMLFHASDGQPLYCPYGLNTAIPAMMIGHIFLFGWIEAIITATVFSYLVKNGMLDEG